MKGLAIGRPATTDVMAWAVFFLAGNNDKYRCVSIKTFQVTSYFDIFYAR